MNLSQALSHVAAVWGYSRARVGLAEGAWCPSGGLLVGGGAGSGAGRRRPPCPPRGRRTARVARIRWTTQVGTMESGQVASTASGGPAGPSQHTISTSCTPLLARSAHTWRPSRRPPPRPGSRSPARARAPSMPRAHGDAGSGVPGTRWSARTIGADRVEADHRVEGHPEAGAATFMTAPAHRVGDLRDRPPAQVHADGGLQVVADLARGHPPGVQADDHRVQPAPSSSGPCAPGAASSEPARTPGGAPSLEGAHLASRWSWSWSRPRALAAGRCRRLSPLHGPGARPARPAGRAPEPPRGRAGSSPRAPVISTSPESICSNRPSRAPVSRNRRATSRPSTGLFLSSVAVIGVSPSIRAYTDH